MVKVTTTNHVKEQLRENVQAAQKQAELELPPPAPAPEPEPKAPAIVTAPATGALVPEMSDLDVLSESAGAGYEDITAQDIALPFWRIAQGLTHQCQAGDPLYIPGLRPGHWFDTITGEYCDEFDFVPCRFVTHYIEWGPSVGDGMVANHGKDRSIFSQCIRDVEKGRWILPNDHQHAGNVVMPTPTWFGIIIATLRRGEEYVDENRRRQRHLDQIETGLMRRAVLTLVGTAEKISRRWLADSASIFLQRPLPNGTTERFQPPMYGMSYHIGSTSTKNNKGTWHLPTIGRAGWTRTLPNGIAIFDEAKEFDLLAREIKPIIQRDEEEDDNHRSMEPQRRSQMRSNLPPDVRGELADDDIPF